MDREQVNAIEGFCKSVSKSPFNFTAVRSALLSAEVSVSRAIDVLPPGNRALGEMLFDLIGQIKQATSKIPR